MSAIRSPKDFWSGVLFVLIGAAALALSAKYSLGTAARMGPGYFPRILGILMIVLGAIIVLRSLRVSGPPLPGWKWRPVLVILGSVIVFGLVVNWLGLVLSTMLLIVLSSAASTEFRPKEAVISGVLLAALAVSVFIIGLKLQMGIWPGSR